MILIHLLCALFVLHDPQADPNVCVCDVDRIEGGWCAKCNVGYCAGLRFTSRKIARTLDFDGHQLIRQKMACAKCRRLIDSGGFCESCKMGYVGGRGYFSRLCYQLARGRPIDLEADDARALRKECCPARGWCDKCKCGVAGNRLYTDKKDYELTVYWVEVLKRAIETSARCESCAEAMIADSRCHTCRITYQDGLPVESANNVAASSTEKRDSAAKGKDSPEKND